MKPAPVFTFHGEPTPGLRSLSAGLRSVLEAHGYRYEPAPKAPQIVFNLIQPDAVQPYRRRAQATFVFSLLEAQRVPEDPIAEFYIYLVRALSNVLMVYTPGVGVRFLTLELGHYVEPEGEGFYERIWARIAPIARSTLVIENRFETDLEPHLWNGDELTRSLSWAGRKLAEWDLLPAPFPLEKILPPRDLRHVKRLYGIGGLSYGNLSVRKDSRRFWMSASGVDKSNLVQIGRDILMVKDYDQNAIVLSVPPGVAVNRVSVDAIEHWMIYREHPDVGAIIHVHAWMDGVDQTQFNYPCGTYELAQAVAEKVRQAPDPACAVVGLKNHGLTITGRTLEEIIARVEGKLLRQVPMS
ncbi:MAG: class II aldolase/adducin family protein [Candidatus Bipolaricaulota bacterium]|nr:class II aldolase/adducin family protein [Candidatus Bipolaricaulota bacterium]MCS7273874.1 class II aldolase/adducin family protein [Candidatus Bipolaricaulota bacterium]MDW8110708.1 class II aldolase/adducin family protein [Candidatus Bipolaricaulota bacterium]MDW8328434.1 class II aldolase/adducin family protein [Candidatus Bipolaricaulota bacterium]